MTEDISTDDLLFEVLTPLGFRVRITRAYWELIIDEIRLSKSDPNVYLFYKSERIGRWVCAVTKRLDGDGFLITTYLTDAIKEGVRTWPK